MAEDSTGATRHARIMQGRSPVFGPTLDALVRDVEARVPIAVRAAHRDMLETWPIDPDGTVQQAEALFDRLAALRAAPVLVPSHISPGSRAKAALGLVLGAVVGVPAGALGYFIAHAALLPYALRDSEALMWIIIAAVIGLCAMVGARQGLRPTRMGHALAHAMIAFLPGAVVFALAAAFAADALGRVLRVSQMEGAFAMGIVFTIMPIGGFLGGVGCAAWAARRAWRRWGAG